MKNNETNTSLKAAVIGTGYLGKFHAQKYASLDGCKLVAVVDRDTKTASSIAEANNTSAITDHTELLGKVDAVSIATPTQTHYQVAHDFLSAGTHVLLEKPITVTVEQAETLVDLALKKGLVLQVGHLERFNTALCKVEHRLKNPRFIESHRLAPFTPRGADVNVVLDLMIHDIDIILNIVDSEVTNIDASGAAIISNEIDIANARLTFANGCVANVTASRVSDKQERRMRFFQKNSYVAVDFQNNSAKVCETGEIDPKTYVPSIHCDDYTLGKGDAILAEIESFLNAIRSDGKPLVSGEDGKRALQTAISISAQLNKNSQE